MNTETIDQLINTELERANSIHPPFVDRHHGYAVLMEEIEEAEEYIRYIKVRQSDMWQDVRQNGMHGIDECTFVDKINAIEHYATEAINELIQVAAMCRKFKALEQ
jgi:hypothetical protein